MSTERVTAWRECYAVIIKSIAAMAREPAIDNPEQAETVKRDPIMREVVKIREALDRMNGKERAAISAPDAVRDGSASVIYPYYTIDGTGEGDGSASESDKCSNHPDAPHGFDRNASHAEDRYVCDCEGWIPDQIGGVGHAVIGAIGTRFKSGNSVPVERAHITAAEYSELVAAIAALRQPVTAQQPAEAVHDSDCAIHDAPAYPARLCDCNASTEPAAAEYTPGDYGMEVGATTHTPAAPLPLAYVAEVVQAQPDPGLGGLRGKCLSWPKGMVNFIVESAPGTRLYTKSLASNAGVPEPRASAWRQALLGYWGLGLDDIAFLEQRALNIERMKGGGE